MPYLRKRLLLAGASLVSLPFSVQAQEVPPEADLEQPAAAEDDGITSGNAIVVTARRRNESLQDVPQTVNAISSETIEKLRINSAADIATIVPGLSIEGGSSGSGGFGQSSGIRGVPTFLLSNANPVVQFYLNEGPGGPNVVNSLFDIGQIEVLKGPQGTLRGRSAPTGAITITTRRPDLDEVGGFVNMSGTYRGNINVQAALGVPIIEDVLAFRVAAVIDHSRGNYVTSANYGVEPYVRQNGIRGTLRFEPTDDISATVMYQRLKRNTRTFAQLVGLGNGFNGPVIVANDRLGITDRPNDGESTDDFLVGQAEWRFAGQKLSYVGSYRDSLSAAASPQDVANVLPGIEYFQTTFTPSEETSHELRLSSEDRIAGIFDYVVGAFYDKTTAHPTVLGTAQFLSGAFGRPGTVPVVQQPVDRYTLRNFITIDPKAVEKSAFANVTAHIGEATELSVGGRLIDYKRRDRFTLNLLPGFNAFTNPLLPVRAACPAAGPGVVASPIYTTGVVCDFPIAAAQLQNVDRRDKFTPFLYNASLSHKFSDDLMVYGTVGSAFRSAGPAIGITAPLTCCTQAGGPNLGSIEDLIFHGEEKSKTYELGFKASALDKRARLNVAVFRQTFDNFFFLTQSTRYLAVSNPANPLRTNAQGAVDGSSVSSAEFTADADAKVKGIDVEASFAITPRWSVNVGYSWSKARLDDALIPCNDGNFDGVVDTIVPTQASFVNARVLVARCRSSEAISRTPRWNLTAQSEYSAPIRDTIDGFVRGNFVYYPDNPNSSQNVVIDNYSLLNMYAGIRDPENAWEVSLFANNLLNTEQVLSINPVAPVSSGGVANFFGNRAAGYQSISYTPRREFGLLVRYAFGSR